MYAVEDPRVPEWGRPLWRVLAEAFPGGIGDEFRDALLGVLRHDCEMSIHATVELVSCFRDGERGSLYNDILRVDAGPEQPSDKRAVVLAVLRAHGLDQVLND